MAEVTFFVPGPPIAKGRGKIVKIGGFSRIATPEKTVSYEGMVKFAAHDAMAGTPMLRGPLQLSVIATFLQPAGWSQARARAALEVPEFVTKKPDMDNIIKALSDGMNSIVFADDSQIAELGKCRKVYGTDPGAWVRVRELLAPEVLDRMFKAPTPRAVAAPAGRELLDEPAPRPPAAPAAPTVFAMLSGMEELAARRRGQQ